jgi:hypothetical protein
MDINNREAQQKIFLELKEICDFPIGHTLRYVAPNGFEHNPDCKRCKLLKLARSIGLGDMIRTPDDYQIKFE